MADAPHLLSYGAVDSIRAHQDIASEGVALAGDYLNEIIKSGD